MWSFFRHSPRLAAQADVFVYAYQWDESLKSVIKSAGPVTIIDYDLPADIERTDFILKFTPVLYARFEAFGLLEKYDSVVCLDSDILVQKELLPAVEQMHGAAGMTRDDCPTVQHNFIYPIAGYDMRAPCYNAGFIVLKRQYFPVGGAPVKTWLYAMLKRYGDAVYLGDQGLINLALQEYGLSLHVFPPEYNLPASFPASALRKASSIHSTGHRKFWCYYYFREWLEGYALYREKGGLAVSVRKDSGVWKKFTSRYTVAKPHIFLETAPDLFRYPVKFLLFMCKYLMRIKY